MNFKTVCGLGRNDYAKKALFTAMDKGLDADCLAGWLRWFDNAKADELPKAEAVPDCDQCREGALGGCHTCIYLESRDEPKPEYYLGDLEEVSHATIKRVEDAMREYGRIAHNAEMPAWVGELFDGIRAEVGEPGYVEGLLP